MKTFLIAIGLWIVSNAVHNLFFLKGELVLSASALISIALYLEISPKKLMYKYLVYLWSCLCVSSIILEPFVEYFGVNDKYYYAMCFVVALSGLYYTLSRSYGLPKDDYTGEGVYLKFKTPKNSFDLSVSMIIRTTCSVSIVVDNEIFFFKKNEPFERDVYRHKETDHLIKIPINRKFAKIKMDLRVGERWDFGNNCCHIAQQLFCNHWFSPLDSIPCIFLRTVERIKEDADFRHKRFQWWGK